MSKIPDHKLIGILMPATFFIAIALSAVAVIAFVMESNSLAIIFTALGAVAWVAIIIEFMMAYEAIVDRWFTKDRSIWAAVWFVISVFLASLHYYSSASKKFFMRRIYPLIINCFLRVTLVDRKPFE